jgi:hypothetical protein
MEDNMRALLAYTIRRSVSAGLFGASLAIGALVPACANVITDWDDKALVLVTPMTAVGATSPGAAACRSCHIEGSGGGGGSGCVAGNNQ